MSQFIIEGGHTLSGSVTASGNKNAALKLLPACILTDQPVILHNIPDISSMCEICCLLLQELGVDIEKIENGSFTVHVHAKEYPYDASPNRDIAASYAGFDCCLRPDARANG